MALQPNNNPSMSPFQQMKPPTGPQITPATAKATGQGGQAQPPYLQMRTPTAPGSAATTPVITPKPMAPGDTVNPPANKPPTTPTVPSGQVSTPPVTPANQSTPPQAGGTDLGGVYNFFKSDLQNQAKQATSNSIADASARGVYYGTPLTGSEADIQTQYQRGLGQLGAGMYNNEQQNQLARLGLASGLGWQGGLNAPPQSPPMDWSGLGALFTNSNSNPQNPTSPQTPGASVNRSGPVITPAANKPTPYSGINDQNPQAKNPYQN